MWLLVAIIVMAGFEVVRSSVVTICLTGTEAQEFAEFQTSAMREGLDRLPDPPSSDELARADEAWRTWATHPDALFVRHRLATLARRPA